MPLINREINLILNWSSIEFSIDNPIAGQEPLFRITDAKLYVPVVTLSTEDNAKLLEQLKSGFKRTINWNKYKPKVTSKQQNRYLDFLLNPGFQGVNRLFVLSFQNTSSRTNSTRYYLPLVQLKNYNVMIDGRKQTRSTLSWSKKKTENVDWKGNIKMFSIIEEAKETILDFSQGTVKVL